MTGNVWEWCWDWYDSEYYASSPGTDPCGPASGSYRMERGGCWGNVAVDCCAAARGNHVAGGKYSYRGFRFVRSLGP